MQLERMAGAAWRAWCKAGACRLVGHAIVIAISESAEDYTVLEVTTAHFPQAGIDAGNPRAPHCYFQRSFVLAIEVLAHNNLLAVVLEELGCPVGSSRYSAQPTQHRLHYQNSIVVEGQASSSSSGLVAHIVLEEHNRTGHGNHDLEKTCCHDSVAPDLPLS